MKNRNKNKENELCDRLKFQFDCINKTKRVQTIVCNKHIRIN